MSDHQSSAKTRTMTSVSDLVDAKLVAGDHEVLGKVADAFRIAITPELGRIMDPAAPSDPIRAQFVPAPEELDTHDWETGDPIGDEVHEAVKGVTHRYPDRVLLKPTHICRVYCRFCFRREKVGDVQEQLSDDELAGALDYIRSRPEIWEVILSGGDPLVLSDRRLARLMAELQSIEHVKVIRFHTRVPIADPARITEDLLSALKVNKAVYVVVHCNHARELGPPARGAIARLVDHGIPVLSQTVLLKGINDTPAELRDLMRSLVETRVKPYYLHHPDLARGTGHFRVSIRRGLDLVRALRGFVSGLCQPTYVLDIPGGFGKVPLTPQSLRETGTGDYEVQDFLGGTHIYRDPGVPQT